MVNNNNTYPQIQSYGSGLHQPPLFARPVNYVFRSHFCSQVHHSMESQTVATRHLFHQILSNESVQ